MRKKSNMFLYVFKIIERAVIDYRPQAIGLVVVTDMYLSIPEMLSQDKGNTTYYDDC